MIVVPLAGYLTNLRLRRAEVSKRTRPSSCAEAAVANVPANSAVTNVPKFGLMAFPHCGRSGSFAQSSWCARTAYASERPAQKDCRF